jgi:hypothetical protein
MSIYVSGVMQSFTMDDLIVSASKQINLRGEPYPCYSKAEVLKWLEHLEVGEEFLICFTDKRTKSKNSALHGWINIIAKEIGESFDVVKYWVVITNFGYTIKEIDGVEVKIPISTSKLDNKNFALGLTKTHAWALQEFNISLPSNDYFKF